MLRNVTLLILALIFLCPRWAHAQDDGPPVSITSPDTGVTFAYATVKDHALIWDKKGNVLKARITFTDAEQNFGQPNDDTHFFRLPGVTFDETKGIFYAVSRTGETIPVARIRKTLFLKTIQTLPNASVRIVHPRGLVTVILEAISPDDPAMHPAPSDPDGTHKIDADKILQ